METKICKKCGRELPLEAFGKHSSEADGLYRTCKKCTNAYIREKKANRQLGGVNADSNPDLAIFTTKALLDEIKARGYRGTLEYRKTITL